MGVDLSSTTTGLVALEERLTVHPGPLRFTPRCVFFVCYMHMLVCPCMPHLCVYALGRHMCIASGLAQMCLQGIVGLGPAWCSLQRPVSAFPGDRGLSPRALPCSWSRLCGWSLGSWKRRSPGGWYGRAWSCGGSCRRSRPPTGGSCRPTRRASSGKPSLCNGCRPRSGPPTPAPAYPCACSLRPAPTPRG